MNLPTYYDKKVSKIVDLFKTDLETGLREDQIRQKESEFGQNQLPQKKQRTSLQIFISQFKNPLIYILLGVAGIVVVIEDYPQNLLESSFVFASVFINSIFGFWEEKKISKVLETLKNILKANTVVIREGVKQSIPTVELVPGDIIVLEPGEKIPADARVFETNNLSVSEAVLTGEWYPTKKQVNPVDKDTALAERSSMVFSGCLVDDGEGKAIVTATGEHTEVGKIAQMIHETKEEKTPLQKKLSAFTKVIGKIILISCAAIFVFGVLEGQPALEIFETAIAISVGGIPEALPIVMTLILVIGMERLAKKKGLVRRLASVETLGSTQVICCDKTRTLTQGKMEAVNAYTHNKEFEIGKKSENQTLNTLLEIAAICNEAFVENPQNEIENWRIGGSPTGRALLMAGAKSGFLKHEIQKKYKPIQILPFDSVHKYQAHLYEDKDRKVMFITGAPEKILEKANTILNDSFIDKLSPQIYENLKEKLNLLTSKGNRVVAVAYKEFSKDSDNINIKEEIEDLTFVGLLSIKDPLRPDAKKALDKCKSAGIELVLITGDHRNTAKAVYEELGNKVTNENILEGKELDNLTDKELWNIVRKIKIYARAEPRHKKRIVDALQGHGLVVAMTGDGVNDAPALKEADIGIALGSGTDVAKETADLVLLNDSFDIIVKAVEEGRVILDNLRKAISYVLADSFTSVFLVGMSILFKWPIPILWTMILWNNIVEDTLPNIAYAFEPGEKDTMKRAPFKSDAPLLNKEMKVLIFATGFIDQLIALIIFYVIWGKLGMSLDYARTMVFGAICLDTAFVVYSYKNLRKNIWDINLFSNKLLNISSLIVVLAFSAAIYAPPLQSLLHTVPLGLKSWGILLFASIISLALIEGTKWIFISRHETED